MARQVDSDIKIQPYSDDQLDAVLSLSSRSLSTTRTRETWVGNNMTAVLAYDRDKLIGAIPLEKRKLSLSHNRFIEVLWVSGAHVDADYRAIGIGTKMDRKIEKYFSEEASGVFVYRGNPDSDAFRWYQKNNYEVLSSIISLEISVTNIDKKDQNYKVTSELTEIDKMGVELESAFLEKYRSGSGYVVRAPDYWVEKLNNHVYKKYYDYKVLSFIGSSERQPYSFLGETSLGDGLHRLDIFEFVAIGSDRTRLIGAIADYAKRKGIAVLRARFVQEDEDYHWFVSRGFRRQNEFFMKARLFDDALRFRTTRYFHSDYI